MGREEGIKRVWRKAWNRACGRDVRKVVKKAAKLTSLPMDLIKEMIYVFTLEYKDAYRILISPLIRLLAISGSSGSGNASKMSFSVTPYPTFGHFRVKR